MKLRINTFTRIFALILVLLIPIVLLYGYSTRTSLEVVRTEVEKSNYKDLAFFASKLDETASSIVKTGLLISQDINIRSLEYIEMASLYEQTTELKRIEEKLRLLNAASTWDTTISIYAPATEMFITTNDSQLHYDPIAVAANLSHAWKYTTQQAAYFRNQPRMVRVITDPYEAPLDKAGLVVELSFSTRELVKSLDSFNAGGKGHPFLINSNGITIAGSGGDAELQRQLVAGASLGSLANERVARIRLAGADYAVSCVWLPTLGFYLLDYIPMDAVVQPITNNGRLFYGSITFLLIGSVAAAYFLYTNLQKPLRELIRGVRGLKKGEYPQVRVFHPSNEFHFLLVSFNDMAVRIEELIQNVLLESIRSRDANLKQLQSQINPHFLYNCFTLIRSLTRLGDREAVMQLTLHLSKYYRYTTRSERETAVLREELELVHSYLAIQRMNVQDLHFEIDVPENMQQLELPRLILQPLVENAVVHGIEPLGVGTVRVSGERRGDMYVIAVADDGCGLSEEKLVQLRRQLAVALTEDMGCALWNTHQRMLLQFGAGSGLRLSHREGGGVVVELVWPIREGGDAHASANDH
ncbi:histidine kinase [Paenibacillus athensensis]|uniref:HAMP domain-containing protein n=1 Tax=Paenibacillus athensensis TaxID=1967502 RepID=A0A4Y8PQT1_9BACL|nr:histidine kinase [Paenibacillus athensensis]MCD1261173.1 histidine kinase [Paenibacillus athensensis]